MTLAACDVLLGLGGYTEQDCVPGPGCSRCDGRRPGRSACRCHRGCEPRCAGRVDGRGWGHGNGIGRWSDRRADLAAAMGAVADAESRMRRSAGILLTLLPNPMAYEVAAVGDAGDAGAGDAGDAGGGGDAGDASDLGNFVTDTVTQLVWERDGNSLVNSFADAAVYCARKGMRVPTRIELVSLIDFTQAAPTINQLGIPRNGAWPILDVFHVPGRRYQPDRRGPPVLVCRLQGRNRRVRRGSDLRALRLGRQFVNGLAARRLFVAFVVVGAIELASEARADAPAGQYAFFDPFDVVITDNYTHLTWQRGYGPLTDFNGAPSYCQALSLPVVFVRLAGALVQGAPHPRGRGAAHGIRHGRSRNDRDRPERLSRDAVRFVLDVLAGGGSHRERLRRPVQ